MIYNLNNPYIIYKICFILAMIEPAIAEKVLARFSPN